MSTATGIDEPNGPFPPPDEVMPGAHNAAAADEPCTADPCLSASDLDDGNEASPMTCDGSPNATCCVPEGYPKDNSGLCDLVHRAMQVDEGDKISCLVNLISDCHSRGLPSLVFVNSTEKLKEVVANLAYFRQYGVCELMVAGDMKTFQGVPAVVVATDETAKGLEFPQLAVVINFDIPGSHQHYVQRSEFIRQRGNGHGVVSLYNKKATAAQQYLYDILDSGEQQAPDPLSGLPRTEDSTIALAEASVSANAMTLPLNEPEPHGASTVEIIADARHADAQDVFQTSSLQSDVLTLLDHQVVWVEADNKTPYLLSLLNTMEDGGQKAIVFVELEAQVEEICAKLRSHGHSVVFEASHAVISKADANYLHLLSTSNPAIIVATDEAIVGIGPLSVDAVINFDLPLDKDSYCRRASLLVPKGEPGCIWSFFNEATRAAQPYLQELLLETGQPLPEFFISTTSNPDAQHQVEANAPPAGAGSLPSIASSSTSSQDHHQKSDSTMSPVAPSPAPAATTSSAQLHSASAVWDVIHFQLSIGMEMMRCFPFTSIPSHLHSFVMKDLPMQNFTAEEKEQLFDILMLPYEMALGKDPFAKAKTLDQSSHDTSQPHTPSQKARPLSAAAAAGSGNEPPSRSRRLSAERNAVRRSKERGNEPPSHSRRQSAERNAVRRSKERAETRITRYSPRRDARDKEDPKSDPRSHGYHSRRDVVSDGDARRKRSHERHDDRRERHDDRQDRHDDRRDRHDDRRERHDDRRERHDDRRDRHDDRREKHDDRRERYGDRREDRHDDRAHHRHEADRMPRRPSRERGRSAGAISDSRKTDRPSERDDRKRRIQERDDPRSSKRTKDGRSLERSHGSRSTERREELLPLKIPANDIRVQPALSGDFLCPICKTEYPTWNSCLSHMIHRGHQPPGEVSVAQASLLQPFESCLRKGTPNTPTEELPKFAPGLSNANGEVHRGGSVDKSYVAPQSDGRTSPKLTPFTTTASSPVPSDPISSAPAPPVNFCPECGHQLKADTVCASFCPNCGASLTVPAV